jgi:Ca2+-binding EF-hand superfamily protein
MPQLTTDGNALQIQYGLFEKLMLHIWATSMYEPDSEEVLLQAFRALDPEGHGYLEEQVIREILTEGENPFSEKEVSEMLAVARDSQTGLIHYEEYVSYMVSQRDL